MASPAQARRHPEFVHAANLTTEFVRPGGDEQGVAYLGSALVKHDGQAPDRLSPKGRKRPAHLRRIHHPRARVLVVEREAHRHDGLVVGGRGGAPRHGGGRTTSPRRPARVALHQKESSKGFGLTRRTCKAQLLQEVASSREMRGPRPPLPRCARSPIQPSRALCILLVGLTGRLRASRSDHRALV